MCEVCNDASGGKDVGVAAVPGAPVSLMWCDRCLQAGAIPMFVVETWLFSGFDDAWPMPAVRPEQPLADWAAVQMVWMNGDGYVSIGEAFPVLWEREYAHRLMEMA